MLMNGLRIGIIAVWLLVTGTQAARHLVPGLGLATTTEPGAALAARMGRTHQYALLWQRSPGAAATQVGTCTQTADMDDVGVRLDTVIDITDTAFIPGQVVLRRALGGQRQAGIRLGMTELLDASLRLRGIEVSGQVFGVAFSAEGPVDHRGLDLAWNAGGRSGKTLLAEVRPERTAGADLAVGLPRGLNSGDRFTIPVSSLDAARLRLSSRLAYFTVGSTAVRRTAGGDMALMQVEMEVDGRRFATLWCDGEGTVYRQELSDSGLALELRSIAAGPSRDPLWPARPPAAPP